MFRSTRLFAALGFALAAFAAMDLPVSAQGTVREHRGRDTPPAPRPTVDRDHRTPKPPPPAPKPGERDHRTPYDPLTDASKGFPPGEMRQWLIRNAESVNPGQEYTIVNLRRQALDMASRWTFNEEDGLDDTTGWGDNGGNWIFSRSDMTVSGALKSNDVVAVFNTKTRRYLEMSNYMYPVWKDKPQYVWRVMYSQAAADGARFALFSLQQRRYVVLCDDALKTKDQPYGLQNVNVCAVKTPTGWRP